MRPVYQSDPLQSSAESSQFSQSSFSGLSPDSSDLFGAAWRYRWAVLTATAIGLIVGYVLFLKTPETFRSHARLLVESDRPAMLDSMTGDIVGGVPAIEILRSQLFSDRVIAEALEDPRFEVFREASIPLRSAIHSSLRLNEEIATGRSQQSMVTLLTFEHEDPELCEKSVQAFSDAIQRFFESKHRSSRGEVLRLIALATDQLQPKIEKLEERYRIFRMDAPLAWNEDGTAINPHRERQLLLTADRSEVLSELSMRKRELAMIQDIAKESPDPVVALSIIGQVMGTNYSLETKKTSDVQTERADLKLATLEVDQQLVPLMIERNKYASEFGDSHPTVRQLDTELTVMKQELKRLVTEQTNRVLELMEQNQVESVDPNVRATEAIKVLSLALTAEVELLKERAEEIDQQIKTEKSEAIKLARYEQEDAAIRREIERNQMLIEQFEEKLARVSLTEEEGGVRVVELTAPTRAGRVGPNLARTLGMGGVAGLLIGCAIAFLLERNANTFRDPEEIVAAVHAPILTHLPFFRGKVRKGRKDSPNPFEKLDPHLAVIHAPSAVAAESIRSCRTSVLFELAGIDGGKIIQVSSPLPGDGKSTIAGNLACSIAQSGKRTLLIDCDLRRPQVTDNFALADELGLVDVLNGKCEPSEATHATPLNTLKMMPSGPIPANPAEALTLPEMSELLEVLREKFDYIILDTPPLLVVTDPSIIASMVDGVVMALKIRRKSKPNTTEAAGILRNVGAKLLGVVINNSDESSASDGYKGYGYYRYGRHTSRYYRQTPDNGAKAGQRRTPVVVSGRAGAAKMADPIAVKSNALHTPPSPTQLDHQNQDVDG